MDDQRYLETGDPRAFASLYGQHRSVVLTELKAAGLPLGGADSRVGEVFARMMEIRRAIDARRPLDAVLRELARQAATEQHLAMSPLQPEHRK